MKRSKLVVQGLVGVMALSIMTPSVLAATPRYLGAHSFSISKGSSSWTGNSSKMWVPSEIGDATLSVSTNKSISVSLYKIRRGPDEKILGPTTFSNGTSQTVEIDDVNSSYYANIQRSQKDGVSGKITLRQ